MEIIHQNVQLDTVCTVQWKCPHIFLLKKEMATLASVLLK